MYIITIISNTLRGRTVVKFNLSEVSAYPLGYRTMQAVLMSNNLVSLTKNHQSCYLIICFYQICFLAAPALVTVNFSKERT